MYLFGLEGSGFIISLGLTLLISGAIMFYILKRFQIVENSLINNAKILQSFINKSQEQQINQNLASNIALNSAIEQQNKINEKIEVSDNESNDNESEVESDNYTTDSENETNNLELVETEANLELDLVETVKVIAMNEFEEFKNDKLLNINSIVELEDTNREEEPQHEENKDIELISNDNDKKDDKLTNYSKFKVGELKDLVLSKNLLSKDIDIGTLKKADLIQLLQNN